MVENRLSRHEELRYQYLLRNLEYLSEREKQEFDYLYQKKLASISSPSHYTQPAAPHDPRPIYQEVNDQAYDGYDDYANWEDEKQWTAPGLPKYPDEAPPKRSKKAKRAYSRFVDVVSKGRKMDIDTVKKLADGRIYDGLQAKENGLVDEIGFEEDCLADLQKKYDLKDAQVIEYTTNTPNFLASWLNQAKTNLLKPQASTEDTVKAIVQVIGTPQAPKAMYYYGG